MKVFFDKSLLDSRQQVNYYKIYFVGQVMNPDCYIEDTDVQNVVGTNMVISANYTQCGIVATTDDMNFIYTQKIRILFGKDPVNPIIYATEVDDFEVICSVRFNLTVNTYDQNVTHQENKIKKLM